jgi:hypothetical protein
MNMNKSLRVAAKEFAETGTGKQAFYLPLC